MDKCLTKQLASANMINFIWISYTSRQDIISINGAYFWNESTFFLDPGEIVKMINNFHSEIYKIYKSNLKRIIARTIDSTL